MNLVNTFQEADDTVQLIVIVAGLYIIWKLVETLDQFNTDVDNSVEDVWQALKDSFTGS